MEKKENIEGYYWYFLSFELSLKNGKDVFVFMSFLFGRPEDTHKGHSASYHTDMNMLYWTDEGQASLGIEDLCHFSVQNISY